MARAERLLVRRERTVREVSSVVSVDSVERDNPPGFDCRPDGDCHIAAFYVGTWLCHLKDCAANISDPELSLPAIDLQSSQPGHFALCLSCTRVWRSITRVRTSDSDLNGASAVSIWQRHVARWNCNSCGRCFCFPRLTLAIVEWWGFMSSSIYVTYLILLHWQGRCTSWCHSQIHGWSTRLLVSLVWLAPLACRPEGLRGRCGARVPMCCSWLAHSVSQWAILLLWLLAPACGCEYVFLSWVISSVLSSWRCGCRRPWHVCRSGARPLEPAFLNVEMGVPVEMCRSRGRHKEWAPADIFIRWSTWRSPFPQVKGMQSCGLFLCRARNLTITFAALQWRSLQSTRRRHHGELLDSSEYYR